jgi:hypothetical protein
MVGVVVQEANCLFMRILPSRERDSPARELLSAICMDATGQRCIDSAAGAEKYLAALQILREHRIPVMY